DRGVPVRRRRAHLHLPRGAAAGWTRGGLVVVRGVGRPAPVRALPGDRGGHAGGCAGPHHHLLPGPARAPRDAGAAPLALGAPHAYGGDRRR
ncbi:MAG: hypothetical protein AVDCRST_MAG11-937, partial [uncultured Gemmatimonadaceae bacterium]